MSQEKPIIWQGSPQFLPKLIGNKVTMRLLSGGQTTIEIIRAYNPYEILLETPKGEIIVPKWAIVVIELVDSPFSCTLEMIRPI